MSYARGPTPARDYAGYDEHYTSSSPTPSPHRYQDFPDYAYTQQRPATRATHTRHKSTSYQQASMPARPPTAHGYSGVPEGVSPRYTSGGVYATANVSDSRSSRKYSWSAPRPSHHERRSSQSYYRHSDRFGESDEDEFFEINGVSYVLPAQSRSRRDSRGGGGRVYFSRSGHGTDYPYYEQVNAGMPSMSPMPAPVDGFPSPTPQPTRRPSQSRRPSTSVPQRSQTARPSSSHHTKKASSHPDPRPSDVRAATIEDARAFGIPEGYSLTHWDPTEHPILLLGSVFDANSLGKWIYDWTVYKHGKGHPIAQMAGDLWLLLIQISGKVKRADEIMPTIRQKEVKEMVGDFIVSGERLTDKLRKLLKKCETPMLQASKRRGSKLGNNAGVEFVLTLFGRERELEATEKFMASVRLWNLRFDANCEEVLLNPGK